MKNKKTKKPAAFLYYFVVALLKLIAKPLLHIKIDKSGFTKPKKPCIVMSNHLSLLDVMYAVSALSPMRLNIVAGRDVFTWKLFKPFLPFLHVIAKSQFGLDLGAIREMKTALDDGCNLYICPEGKTSLDGTPLHHLPPSIGKFVKFCGAPVVAAKIEGSYLTMPRYFHGVRRGKVRVTLKTIVSDEEVGKLSAPEIYKRIVESLAFNDHLYQLDNNIRFRSKTPAENLNYILYRCSKCGAEYENFVEEDGRHLVCRACGNRVEYTQYGKLVADSGSVSPERIDLWYKLERDAVREELLEDNFSESQAVELLGVDAENNYILRGEGILTVNREKIIYEGSENGEVLHFETSIVPLHTITTKTKEGIDLMDGDSVRRFMFKDKKHSTKWGIIVEENYRLNNPKLFANK